MISVAKLKRSIVVAFIVAGLGTGAVAPTVAQAASTNSSTVIKIVFPKGSFCGSYSGRIGSGRTFRLGLGANLFGQAAVMGPELARHLLVFAQLVQKVGVPLDLAA